MDKLTIAGGSQHLDAGSKAEACLHNWQLWEIPRSAPLLASGQVHLWMVDRRQLSTSSLTLAIPVSLEERERAGAYHFTRDRVRYLTARAVIRDLLACYLEIRPAEVSLTQGAEGKPQLADPNPTRIQFNITHTDRFTLIAITRSAAIGVDMEAVELKPEKIQLARHILSEREQVDFDALPKHQKLDGFYQMWTMKEAVLKAFGTGFHVDPQNLDLGIARNPINVQEIVFEGENRGLWTLIQLPLAVGYRATLAVEGSGGSLACWRWVGPLQS